MPKKLESFGHYETLNIMRLGGRDLVLAFHPASGQYMTHTSHISTASKSYEIMAFLVKK